MFSHGWPHTADAWDDQLFLVASNGYRAVAHDRRGGGRSGQPWNGNDLDTYADDLAELIEALDLHDAILVGHSTGGGEVTRYIGRHGTSRVAKAVLVSAIPPLMLKTDANPGCLPIEVFDGLRASLSADRSQFYQDISAPFYGANRPGNTVSQGLRDSFWLLSMTVGVKGAYDCIKAFSETDLTEDLKKIDVPTLIIHGDDDQIVPIAAAAQPWQCWIARQQRSGGPPCQHPTRPRWPLPQPPTTSRSSARAQPVVTGNIRHVVTAGNSGQETR